MFLDHEIQELQRILQAAKELRNRRTGLGSLPDELLVYVMRLLQDAHPPGSLAVWSVTHTCRRLRVLGLGCPAFWTTFSTSFLSSLTITMPVVLPRSGSLPLSLRLRKMTSHEVAFVRNQLIGLCGSRIHSVYLEPASASDAAALINTFISKELSELEEFHLKIPPSWVSNVQLPSSRNIPPRLIRLALDGVPFKRASPIYDNLRFLSITRPPGALELTYADAMDLASRMHNVETLILNHCTDTRSFADANARQLPVIKQSATLRKLVFTSLGVRNLLMRLAPLPWVNMEIIDSTPPNKAMLSAMSDEDKGFYDPLELHVAEYMRPKAAKFVLQIDNSGRAVVSWSFWRAVPAEGSLAASAPDFYLQRFVFQEEPFPTHFQINVLSNIIDLGLDVVYKQWAEHWETVLKQLSFILTLKTLRLTERTFFAPDLAPMLDIDPRGLNIAYKPLPEIHTLAILPYTLVRVQDVPLKVLEELVHFLQRRATEGRPLFTLCLPTYWSDMIDKNLAVCPGWRGLISELQLL